MLFTSPHPEIQSQPIHPYIPHSAYNVDPTSIWDGVLTKRQDKKRKKRTPLKSDPWDFWPFRPWQRHGVVCELVWSCWHFRQLRTWQSWWPWQWRVTLDSIRNSCNVYNDHHHDQARPVSNRVRGARQLSWLKSHTVSLPLFAWHNFTPYHHNFNIASALQLSHHYNVINIFSIHHIHLHFHLILHPGCNSARRLHNDIRRHRGARTMKSRRWNGIKN